MANENIHSPDDGRGASNVFCDGVLLDSCVLADTDAGYAICAKTPREIDHVNECLVTERVEGKS